MAANTAAPSKIRPWALARVGGTAVSRLKSLPSMASFMSLAEPTEGTNGSPNGSVLSLPASEAKEDAKNMEDLRVKLQEANAALKSKDETITELLERVSKADSALISAHTEASEQKSLLEDSEHARERAEKDCQDLQEQLTSLHAERVKDQSELEAVRREVR